MKNFKTIVGLMAVVAAMAICTAAKAQQYSGQFELITLTATNKQGVAVTNSVPTTGNTINLSKNSHVALMIQWELMASGTSTGIWEFAFSDSGTTNFQTQGAASPFIVTLTCTGTTPTYFYTNVTVGALPYLTLRRQGNNGTQIVSNCVVKAWPKPTL